MAFIFKYYLQFNNESLKNTLIKENSLHWCDAFFWFYVVWTPISCTFILWTIYIHRKSEIVFFSSMNLGLTWCICDMTQHLGELVLGFLGRELQPSCQLACLETVRILSRDKDGLDPFISRSAMSTLARYAGITKPMEDQGNPCQPHLLFTF